MAKKSKKSDTPDDEKQVVAVFLELVGREPTKDEMHNWLRVLRIPGNQVNMDTLRYTLSNHRDAVARSEKTTEEE